jgi:SAM-dependent methyltransferase
MEKDRKKWNAKHRSRPADNKPSEVVRRFAGLACIGRALDIAAGNGRNAAYLADLGFSVDAVDISEVGLARSSHRHPHIHTIQADLDTYVIAEDTYDLIINLNFLQRRLFPLVADGLSANGVLIFKTFVLGDSQAEAGPRCRDYLLRPNELLHAFSALRVIYYNEEDQPTNGNPPMATLVARRR